MNWRRISAAILLLLTVMSAAACKKDRTMKGLADKRKLVFGVSVKAGDVLNPEVVKLIDENFNLIVPEDTMKWMNIRPKKTFWNWGDMDNMVKFAEEHKIRMKGHTFLWHQQNPPYVSSLKTKEEAVTLMTEQISTIMDRYRGRIQEYDVCNEPMNEDGTMRDTVWYRTIGPDYLDLAFRTARDADPKAVLVLNDFNNETKGNPKADGFYNLVKGMVDRGVPIDGVGFQMHLAADLPFNEKAIRENIKRFNDLGLSVSFTEIDVRVPVPADAKTEAEQTRIYKALMDMALTEKKAGSFVMWGYTDKLSWIPRNFPGYGAAHLFDDQVRPKAVYYELKDMLDTSKGKKIPRETM